MVASGVSRRLNVLPGWPFCPPVLLPDRSRKLLVRAGFFFRPSLDGGLPLLPLFRGPPQNWGCWGEFDIFRAGSRDGVDAWRGF
jgi:hypothetical protein